ncbi:hypothetical protein Pfo_016211 [Paulownia fortunei]|nr:hypothetical protein Pfo_016211 [Paulownia fortunei]
MMHNMEEIASSLGAQIFEFSESELFPETLQNSEVASISSNCCYEEHSSYPTHLSITVDMNKYNSTVDNNIKLDATASSPATPTAVATRNSNLSIFLEDQLENDISASIDFTPSPSFSVPHQQYFNNNNNQEPFSMSSLNNQISLGDAADGSLYTAHQYTPERRPMVAPPLAVGPGLGPALPTAFKEECLSSVPSYIRLRTSSPACTLVDPMVGPYFPSGSMSAPFSFDNSGIFTGGTGLLLGTDLSHQELEFQGDNGGLFLPDSMARIFNCSSGDLQALSNESQHLLHGSPSTTLASDISSLEDPSFKVGKLSVEERKRKIHRYMKKRNERNFSKKIKYACRKTLADSRPRVRGRFAKNDEVGEIARTTGTNHEDDTDEDVVKEEEDMEDSDILAHISGVNSFKCNYPIQSWI